MTDTPQGESPSAQWPPPPNPTPPVTEPGEATFAGGWLHSSPSVSITYQLTEDEIVRSVRFQVRRNRNLRLILGAGVFVSIVGIVILGFGASGFGAVLLGMGAYLLALSGFVIVQGPRRSWRRNPSIRNLQSLTFSDEGVEAQTAIAHSKARWDLYPSLNETDDCYLLRVGHRRVFNIIPKRAFRTRDDEGLFRGLVTRHTDAHLR